MSTSSFRKPAQMAPEDVYAVAVRIVDEHGLAALTMRRLAEAMGVAPMSLYRFVSSKEQLVMRVREHMLAELEPADPALTWRERLTHEVVALRAAVRRHAGLVDLLTTGEDAVPALDGLRERVLTIMREAGVDDATAVDAIGSLFALTLGFAVAGRARGVDGADEPYRRLRELPPQDYPNLRAMAGNYGQHWSDGAFRFGVQAILDAMAA